MLQFTVFSLVLALFLAFLWGFVWSQAHHRTKLGRYLRLNVNWLVVVTGVGIDLLLMLLVLGQRDWIEVCGIVFASSILPVAYSLHEQYNDLRGEIDDVRSASDDDDSQ